MIFQVDKEGEHAIQQLCDIALKAGGIQNLERINQVLESVELISEPDSKEDEDKEIKK